MVERYVLPDRRTARDVQAPQPIASTV
jgi:hypothetical protein